LSPLTGRTTILRISYDCGGPLVTAAVTDPKLNALTRRLFAPYCVAETDVTDEPRVRIGAGDDGFVLDDGAAATVFGTRGEALEAYEFALTSALLASRSDLPQLHASGVAIGGRACLALGGQGAGKSSLALAWCVDGHAVLGDDIVFLPGGRRAMAFKRLFKVDSSVLKSMNLDPAATPFWEPGSVEAWFDPADAAGWADVGEIDVVAIVRHREGGGTEVRRMAAADGLSALLASLMPSGLGSRAAFATLADIAAAGRFFRIEFSDARDAAAVLGAL